MGVQRLLLAGALCAIATNSGGVAGEESSLYEEGGDVIVLTPENFQTVFEHGGVWLVEYYASWCGHCRHFVPVYQKFAENVKGWQPMGRVGAINCAQHSTQCNEHKIERFPTIRVYDAAAEDYTDGRPCQARNETSLLHCMAKDVANTMGVMALETLSESLPAFLRGRGGADYLVAVFEKESANHTLAWAFTADSVGGRLAKVVAASEDEGSEYGLGTFPAMAVFARGNSTPLHIWTEVTRVTVLPYLHGLEEGKSHEVALRSSIVQSLGDMEEEKHEGKQVQVAIGYNISAVHASDLVTAVYRLLEKEVVATHTELSGGPLKALTRFVGALSHNLPLPAARRPLIALYVMLSSLHSRGLAMTSSEWKDFLAEWSIEGVRTPSENVADRIERWTVCRGSSPRYRGYTCGLWLLLHTLTVNCAEGDTDWCGGSLINIIRDFIVEYFACEECRVHFAAALDREGTEAVKGWSKEQAALWLWRAHNIVNHRLESSPSTDPTAPKIQFPPAELCEKCRSSTDATLTQFGVGWNTFMVYDFLNQHYGRGIVLDLPKFPWVAFFSVAAVISMLAAVLWRNNLGGMSRLSLLPDVNRRSINSTLKRQKRHLSNLWSSPKQRFVSAF